MELLLGVWCFMYDILWLLWCPSTRGSIGSILRTGCHNEVIAAWVTVSDLGVVLQLDGIAERIELALRI